MQEERPYGMTTGESAQNVDPNSELYQAQDSPGGKKKSMIGIVKDKAKKLKSKMKVKKPGSGDGDSSSGEEEEESDQSPVPSDSPGLQSNPSNDSKDRGMEDEKLQPPSAGTDQVQKRFGELNLGPKSSEQPQVDTSMEEERKPRSLTSDQAPQSEEKVKQPESGKGADPGSVETYSQDQAPQSEEEKTVLQQAREVVAGSPADKREGEKQPEEQPQPTITSRAADTVYGLKDSLATKLGYGASRPTTTAAESESSPDDTKPPSITARAATTVLGLKDTVTSKLGYGSSPTGAQPEGINPEETNAAQKSYIQRAQELAIGGKDAVLTKLGYSGAPGEGDTDEQKSHIQKMQGTAYGAKDAVADAEQREPPKMDDYQSPSRFHPGVEDKALSTIITDAMSNSATTVKKSVMSTFGGSNTDSSATPAAPSAPSDAAT